MYFNPLKRKQGDNKPLNGTESWSQYSWTTRLTTSPRPWGRSWLVCPAWSSSKQCIQECWGYFCVQESKRGLSRKSSDLHGHGWNKVLLQCWTSWRKRGESQPRIPWMPLYWAHSSWDAPRARFVNILQNYLIFLGAVHEQSRPDRDFYVSILMENVQRN